MSRRLLLDDSPGEQRAVVLLDGRPERLWIERQGEGEPLGAGAVALARVRRIERGLKLAFLDLGDGEAVLPLTGHAVGAAEGQTLKVEIAAPARRGKAPVARSLGPAQGEPRLIEPALPLAARLQAVDPDAPIERGPVARDGADAAEEAALAREHPLGEGASLAVERTRGLTAVDVDLGGAGQVDSRRAGAKTNLLAIAESARLLRLKGLGGLVVFDLIGDGRDGEALLGAAREAFRPDMPGVAFGPVSRLGVFHLALPWRTRPVEEVLNDEAGLPSARTVAQRMARAVEREAAHAVRIHAACAPDVAAAAAAVLPALVARLGPRVDIRPDPALGREAFVVTAR